MRRLFFLLNLASETAWSPSQQQDAVWEQLWGATCQNWEHGAVFFYWAIDGIFFFKASGHVAFLLVAFERLQKTDGFCLRFNSVPSAMFTSFRCFTDGCSDYKGPLGICCDFMDAPLDQPFAEAALTGTATDEGWSWRWCVYGGLYAALPLCAFLALKSRHNKLGWIYDWYRFWLFNIMIWHIWSYDLWYDIWHDIWQKRPQFLIALPTYTNRLRLPGDDWNLQSHHGASEDFSREAEVKPSECEPVM